jgi:transposase
LRAYFVEEMPAAEVADKFGYSTRSVHQMATLLRTGKMSLFAESKPGPKKPRKVTGQVRTKALKLRAAGHSITEISVALTARGLPVSAQTVWQILQEEGLPRLGRRDDDRRGIPVWLDPVKAAALPSCLKDPVSMSCDHAGLLLLLPGVIEVGPHELVKSVRYPSTSALSAWQSIGFVAVGQVRPQAPPAQPRLAHRRRRTGLHPGPDRAA